MISLLLSALSGISLFAAYLHFMAGTRPLNKAQLWFSALCLIVVFFNISLLAGFEAQSVAKITGALHWQISIGLLFFLLFPWLTTELTGRRHKTWIRLSSALGLALIVLNLFQPGTVQFETIAGIKPTLLPWGETISVAYGPTNPWLIAAASYVFAIVFFSLLAFIGAHRREPRGPFLWLALAIGGFLLSVLAGLLTRAQLFDIPPPAPLGFLFMILIMSGILIRDWRGRILASEQHYRYLMQQSPRSILRVSPEGRILDVNAAFEKLWEVSAESVRGYDLLSDDQLLEHGIVPHIRQALAGSANEFPPIVYNPVANPTLPGPPRDRLVSGIIYPILDRTGRVLEVVLVQDDVTERVRAQTERENLQRQLMQSQKMESIGRLTGGIAHDFNNMLGVMLGYAELLRDSLTRPNAAPSQMQRFTDEILAAGKRAKELIATMQTFSRRRPSKENQVPVIQLAPMVQEAMRLLQASIPSTIALRLQIEAEDMAARIHPVQLHQILLNFTINARDAIGEHGRITVRLHRQRLQGVCCSCHAPFDGEYAVLSVSDTGTGIPEHLLPEIFTPYFTSKEVGKGTGMGLSVVHGLLHELGGHITVDIRQGSGTTMHALLLLETSTSHLESPDATSKDVQTPRLDGLNILVLDDEPAMADMLTERLRRQGAVVACHNLPLAALADFAERPQYFDLVVSDVTMPGISGLEIARRLLQQKPTLPIILCTGYSQLVDAESAAQHGISALLYKPISAAKLIETAARLTRQDVADKSPQHDAAHPPSYTNPAT